MFIDRDQLEYSVKSQGDKAETHTKVDLENINLENYMLKTEDGKEIKLSLKDAIEIKEKINASLSMTANIMFSLSVYHKESAHYWLNDLSEENYMVDEDESNFPFGCSITCNDALEHFYKMDGSKEVVENSGLFVSDMEKIYEKVVKDFFNEFPEEKENYDFHYYRSDLSGYSKSFENSRKFLTWIDEKFVQPYVHALLKFGNIDGVKLTKKSIDFKYSKK